jgi:hypothetical protein
MSFMANAPKRSDTSVDAIENDGWFPDIDVSVLRDATRFDGTVTDARLAVSVVDAMLTVNLALDDWKRHQIAKGYGDLAEVPAGTINKQSQHVAHYLRAVYSMTKADLIEKYRDYDSTASSQSDKKQMEWLDTAPDLERRNAQWAISNIIGRSHMTVELI